jgi:hypothetical protein
MDGGHISFVSVHFSVKFRGDHAGGHSQNGHLLCGANCVHPGVCKFHLSAIHIVDQLVVVHKVNANDIFVQFSDHIYRACKLSSFNPQVHLVNPDGVHCIPGGGDAALSIRYFIQFLHSKCGVK